MDDWRTLRLPKPIAAAGAWAQGQLEPVIPDAIDGGEAPFIKPFMIAMADDHYALDIRRARDLLGWEPRHRLKDELPRLVAALKNDPAGWYETNGVTPPPGSARQTTWVRTRRNYAPAMRRKSGPSTAPTAGRISSIWALPLGSSLSRC